MKLVTRTEGRFNISSVNDFRRKTDFALDMESRCEMVMKGVYQPTESDSDVFNMFQQWKSYTKEHLTIFTMPNFEKFERRQRASRTDSTSRGCTDSSLLNPFHPRVGSAGIPNLPLDRIVTRTGRMGPDASAVAIRST